MQRTGGDEIIDKSIFGRYWEQLWRHNWGAFIRSILGCYGEVSQQNYSFLEKHPAFAIRNGAESLYSSSGNREVHIESQYFPLSLVIVIKS